VVLEKDGEDQLDRSCDESGSITQNQGEDNYSTNKNNNNNKRKANWIGHFLYRNCLIKCVIEGKRQGGIEVRERQGGRSKQLLNDLREVSEYWKLKEEAIARTLW
jgi:hypothetical protein